MKLIIHIKHALLAKIVVKTKQQITFKTFVSLFQQIFFIYCYDVQITALVLVFRDNVLKCLYSNPKRRITRRIRSGFSHTLTHTPKYFTDYCSHPGSCEPFNACYPTLQALICFHSMLLYLTQMVLNCAQLEEFIVGFTVSSNQPRRS